MGSETERPESELGHFGGVIALDGPSGTGKSTVARGVAHRLGARYLDTGAMYRTATVAVLRAGASLDNPSEIAAALAGHDIVVGTDPRSSSTLLDGVSVETEIRSAEITAAVSAVAAVPAVRQLLVAQQRQIIAMGPIVAEGRDVGSVVWPQADLKIYLTASEAVRARRRAAEIGDADVAQIAESLRRRDGFDSTRAISPLHHADGATQVDTSDLTVEQVITVLIELAEKLVGAGQHA